MGRGRSLFALDSDDDRARELEFARDLGVMAPLKKKYLFCPILHKQKGFILNLFLCSSSVYEVGVNLR